jgi:hypothetical protein
MEFSFWGQKERRPFRHRIPNTKIGYDDLQKGKNHIFLAVYRRLKIQKTKENTHSNSN